MPSPISLFFTDFEDEHGRLSYYWDRLQSLDVPVPNTTFVALGETESGYDWDTDKVLDFMETNDYDRAFVRTERKAATVRLREGSFIYRRDADAIDGTVESLLNQNDQQWWPHGGGLVVREWVDLDFCSFPTHSHHPSIRFFVDDAEVVGQTPHDPDPYEMVCEGHYDYLESVLDDVEFETPREYAERIAEEFDGSTWGVDFALDTRGNWYCTEFNFNGVYWNRAEEKYWNTCGQGDNEPWSPVEIHSAALWGVRPEKSSGPEGRWW